MEKIGIEEMIKMARAKHDRSGEFANGGYTTVERIEQQEDFIVFSVCSKTCNVHGSASRSGITMWGGWYAFDGKKEIQLIPMAMWRDGENYRNDKPWNRWLFVKFEGRKVVFENWDTEAIKTIEIDFSRGGA